MNVASFQFLVLALSAAGIYNLFSPVGWRQWTLLGANLFFLATFTKTLTAFLPLAGFLLIGFIGVRTIESPTTRKAFGPLLVTTIAAFMWLKKYTFWPSESFLRFSYVTVGMSYVLFRTLHLIIDTEANNLPAKISLLSYLNYTLNFMTLVSGPIQRYEEFAQAQLAPSRGPLTIFMVGEGVHRLIVGFFKVTVLSWLLAMLQKAALGALQASAPLHSKLLTGALIATSYPLYLYSNFSGYTDIVIGIGKFFRFTLPENFDRPFSSDNFIEFWSRWHITLSNWLKTYVFNPLLLAEMRRNSATWLEPFLAVPALFVTFFLVGVWHGQTSEFLVFGFLQGFGVAINKLYQVLLAKLWGKRRYRSLASSRLYIALSRGVTFTWFTLTLLWFWSDWKQIGEIFAALGVSATLLALLVIFCAATAFLSVVEEARKWVRAIRWDGSPVLLSRYALTVFDTALTVFTLAVIVLLNAPAPDIVYKAF